MKKALKIGGCVVGTVLVAALVIIIFFPGLFTYISVKHKYKDIDRTIPEFEEVSVPADFEEYTLHGLTFKAPAGRKGDSSSAIKNDDMMIMVLGTTVSSSALELSGYDPWQYYEYEKDDYRHFFKTIGHEFPDNADNRLLWFIKDELSAKMCLHLRFTDRKVFKEFAEIKDGAWDTEETWKADGGNFTGYASHMMNSKLYAAPLWTYSVYPDEDTSPDLAMYIKDADEETARQIISSVRLK